MRAIDTNVAARFLLNDDPDQYRIACRILAEPAFVPTTVLLELGWLLGSRYKLPRAAIVEAILALIDLPAVRIVDRPKLIWALSRFAAGADLADMIHIGASGLAASFATFEKTMSSDAGSQSPIPVEALG